jgi:ferric-dicitrate binding protein FerR (iron transport regulator)
MDEAQWRELLTKYISGNATPQEEAMLESWYNSHIRKARDRRSGEPGDLLRQRELIWQEIAARTGVAAAPAEIRPRVLWPRIVAAASVVLALSIGLIFYLRDKARDNNAIAYHNDVGPGKKGATLTLADGTKIRLSQAGTGQLASQSGVRILKNKEGNLEYLAQGGEQAGARQVNMLSTGKGETYELDLPDGTKVWLNAASSIRYPANFTGLAQRQVELTGEGYFEVAHDKAHPFTVKSGGQEVEVLGTHFNINSYADEAAVATTLLEGSVRVTSGGEVTVLKPGQEALNSANGVTVLPADVEGVIDWKKGDFYLDDVDFRVAMRKIARWYGVEVIYDASVPQHIRSGGWISRNTRLSAVLELIQSSGQVHFKIDGRKLYVSK